MLHSRLVLAAVAAGATALFVGPTALADTSDSLSGEISASQAVALAVVTAPELVSATDHETSLGTPVDPTFVAMGGTLTAEKTLTPATVRLDGGGAFTVAGIGFLPVDPNPTATAPLLTAGGDAAVVANSGVDADTILRPTPLGVEAFIQIRSNDASERFEWAVQLPEGDELSLVDAQHVAITQPMPQGGSDGEADAADFLQPPPATRTDESQTDATTVGEASTELAIQEATLAKIATVTGALSTIGVITAPWAVDAEGREVPVALSIEGHVLTMTVSHRDRSFAYPIEADPAALSTSGCYQSGTSPFPYVLGRGYSSADSLPDCRMEVGGLMDKRYQVNGQFVEFNMQNDGTGRTVNGLSGDPWIYGLRDWPIYDSNEAVIGYIYENQLTATTNQFTVYKADATTVVGMSDPTKMTPIKPQGRGWLMTDAAEAETVMVGFPLLNGTNGVPLSIRAFILRLAFAGQTLSTNGWSNDQIIDNHDAGCGSLDDYNPDGVSTSSYGSTVAYQTMGGPDMYQSVTCTLNSVVCFASKDPNAGGPLADYFSTPWANMVYFATGSTAVKFGGRVRGLLLGGTGFDRRDYVSYADPNVPCTRQTLAKWRLGFSTLSSGRHMWGQYPLRSPTGTRSC